MHAALITVDGIPAHPLVVHAAVVLLPLAVLGALLIAVRPAWRRRYGGLVAVVTVLGVASVPVAQQTGQQLYARLAALQNPKIAEHAAQGDGLLVPALVFGALVVGLVVAGRVADRPAAPSGWRVATAVVAVLVVLSGAATTVQVVRIGHSGSTAVWEGVGGS